MTGDRALPPPQGRPRRAWPGQRHARSGWQGPGGQGAPGHHRAAAGRGRGRAAARRAAAARGQAGGGGGRARRAWQPGVQDRSQHGTRPGGVWGEGAREAGGAAVGPASMLPRSQATGSSAPPAVLRPGHSAALPCLLLLPGSEAPGPRSKRCPLTRPGGGGADLSQSALQVSAHARACLLRCRRPLLQGLAALPPCTCGCVAPRRVHDQAAETLAPAPSPLCRATRSGWTWS